MRWVVVPNESFQQTPGDWLDHFICFEEEGARHVVGGTNKGLILHATLRPERRIVTVKVPNHTIQRTRDTIGRRGWRNVASR